MKSYPIVCPSCNGAGAIQNVDLQNTANTSLTMVCPACNGTKVVTVNET